jgi:putative transposase
MKKRFTEEQIIGLVKRLDAGEKPKDLGREQGVSEQTIYNWKRRYGGMEVSEMRRLRELEQENSRLKRLLANAIMDIDLLKAVNSKNW